MSEDEIVSVYQMGLDSIKKIDEFIKQNGNLCHFRKVPSFMYTNSIFGVSGIEKEHQFRLKHNFKSNCLQKRPILSLLKLRRAFIMRMEAQSLIPIFLPNR